MRFALSIMSPCRSFCRVFCERSASWAHPGQALWMACACAHPDLGLSRQFLWTAGRKLKLLLGTLAHQTLLHGLKSHPGGIQVDISIGEADHEDVEKGQVDRLIQAALNQVLLAPCLLVRVVGFPCLWRWLKQRSCDWLECFSFQNSRFCITYI